MQDITPGVLPWLEASNADKWYPATLPLQHPMAAIPISQLLHSRISVVLHQCCNGGAPPTSTQPWSAHLLLFSGCW